MRNEPRHGAFVISLDFELRWGVFNIDPDNAMRDVLDSRPMVTRTLALFRLRDTAAT